MAEDVGRFVFAVFFASEAEPRARPKRFVVSRCREEMIYFLPFGFHGFCRQEIQLCATSFGALSGREPEAAKCLRCDLVAGCKKLNNTILKRQRGQHGTKPEPGPVVVVSCRGASNNQPCSKSN